MAERTLKMPGDVLEGGWVPIDIEGAQIGDVAILLTQLVLKEAREI